MKYKILTLVLIVVFSLTAAQTKKKVITSKPSPNKSVTVTPSGFLTLLGVSIDEANSALETMLTNNNISVQKVVEDITYQYDENYKKKEEIDYKNIYLYLDSENSKINLTTLEDKIVQIEIVSGYIENLEKLFKTNGLKLIEKLGDKSIFENQNSLAILDTDYETSYYLLITKKDNAVIQNFSINDLSTTTNFEDAASGIVNLLKQKYPYIGAKSKDVLNNSKYEYIEKKQELIFKNNINAIVSAQKMRKTISVSANPLQMANIKSLLDIKSWEKRYTDRNGVEYFRKNDVMLKLEPDYLEITPVPPRGSEALLNYSKPITFDELVKIYNDFNDNNARVKYLEDFYYSRKTFDKDGSFTNSKSETNFCQKNDASKACYYFGDQSSYNNNWGFVFLVDSYDKNAVKSIVNEVTENFVTQDFRLDDLPGVNRTQFYVKEKYLAERGNYEEKQRIAKEEEERRAEIARQKKAERDERNRKNAEEITAATLQFLETLKRK